MILATNTTLYLNHYLVRSGVQEKVLSGQSWPSPKTIRWRGIPNLSR